MSRPDLRNITFGERLREVTMQYPEREALVCDALRWTYRELDETSDRMAAGLLAWGLRRGDVLGIWCESEPNTVLLLCAALKLGVTAAMINTSLVGEEVSDILRRSDVRFLAIGEGYKDVRYAEVCASLPPLPGLERIFSISRTPQPGLDGVDRLLADAACVSGSDLREAMEAVQPTDPATMLYTSGTTSRPKIVVDTQCSRINLAMQQAYDLRVTCEDRFCTAMPLFHCFCMSVNTLAALTSGACLVLCPDRHTQTIIDVFSREKCTVFSCVPALFHAIVSRPNFDPAPLRSLRIGYIGGSLYPPALFRQIEDRLGFTLMSSLGQTEAGAGVTTCQPDDPLDVRAETVGRFLAYVEGKTVDIQTGMPLGAGETGEICIRGYNVMQGYYHAPEDTAKAIDAEGFLHTGDMGYLDAQGNLHLTGRLKDLIIRGGENISPAEIEAAAGEDPRVHTCRAVGVPDDHYGEEVCLCVQLEAGASCTADELRSRLAAVLAHYKVPKYVLFMEEFPRTNTGKIRTGELVKQCCDILFSFVP